MAVEVTLDTGGMDRLSGFLGTFDENDETNVLVADVMHDSFISAESPYPNLESLVIAGGIDPALPDDELEAHLASEEFSQFLQKCTRFGSFSEMYQAAAKGFLVRHTQGS